MGSHRRRLSSAGFAEHPCDAAVAVRSGLGPVSPALATGRYIQTTFWSTSRGTWGRTAAGYADLTIAKSMSHTDDLMRIGITRRSA
jgi:hypothetical protein